MLFGIREKRKIKRDTKFAIAEINEIIFNDDLGKGRFCMTLERLTYQRYMPNGGFTALIRIKLEDFETGLFKFEYVNYSSISLKSKLAGIMNNFIVRDIRPPFKTRDESIDYRGCNR